MKKFSNCLKSEFINSSRKFVNVSEMSVVFIETVTVTESAVKKCSSLSKERDKAGFLSRRKGCI